MPIFNNPLMRPPGAANPATPGQQPLLRPGTPGTAPPATSRPSSPPPLPANAPRPFPQPGPFQGPGVRPLPNNPMAPAPFAPPQFPGQLGARLQDPEMQARIEARRQEFLAQGINPLSPYGGGGQPQLSGQPTAAMQAGKIMPDGSMQSGGFVGGQWVPNPGQGPPMPRPGSFPSPVFQPGNRPPMDADWWGGQQPQQVQPQSQPFSPEMGMGQFSPENLNAMAQEYLRITGRESYLPGGGSPQGPAPTPTPTVPAPPPPTTPTPAPTTPVPTPPTTPAPQPSPAPVATPPAVPAPNPTPTPAPVAPTTTPPPATSPQPTGPAPGSQYNPDPAYAGMTGAQIWAAQNPGQNPGNYAAGGFKPGMPADQVPTPKEQPPVAGKQPPVEPFAATKTPGGAGSPPPQASQQLLQQLGPGNSPIVAQMIGAGAPWEVVQAFLEERGYGAAIPGMMQLLQQGAASGDYGISQEQAIAGLRSAFPGATDEQLQAMLWQPPPANAKQPQGGGVQQQQQSRARSGGGPQTAAYSNTGSLPLPDPTGPYGTGGSTVGTVPASAQAAPYRPTTKPRPVASASRSRRPVAATPPPAATRPPQPPPARPVAADNPAYAARNAARARAAQAAARPASANRTAPPSAKPERKPGESSQAFRRRMAHWTRQNK